MDDQLKEAILKWLLTSFNSATLLLTHSPTQKLNQQRLETFLATSPIFFSTVYGFDDNDSNNSDVTLKPAASQSSPTENHKNTFNTTEQERIPVVPSQRHLDLALKILELYALHILPRNDEWDYAREFIQMNGMLDEERRQAFLIALHVLREDERLAVVRGEEQKQARGRRKSMKSEEDRNKDKKRRQSAVTAASESTFSGEVAAGFENSVRATKDNANNTSTAAPEVSRSKLGSESRSKTPHAISGRERNHLDQRTDYSSSTISQHTHATADTTTSEPTNNPSIAFPDPTPASKSQNFAKQVAEERQLQQILNNKLKNTKQQSLPTHHSSQNKSESLRPGQTPNKNNNNILTKVLSPFFSTNSNSPLSALSSTSPINTVLAILKSLLSYLSLFSSTNSKSNKHASQTIIVRSILCILAVLMGMGVVGSADTATDTAGTRMTTTTTGGLVPAPLRMQRILRALRNLLAIVWMSVKRTVGMGVAVSYV